MKPEPSSGMLFPLSDELPEGFVYQPEFLSVEEEAELLQPIHDLAFQEFDFHGYTAKRRVIEYGLEYDFSTRKANKTQPFPEFLLPLRERAASFAGLKSEALVEGIVIEYPPGAPIGWHRDAPQFGIIVGISLASAARMRLKPYLPPNKTPEKQTRLVSLILEPRSIYVMRGPARWKYQHSIPAVTELRYSITFRTLRDKESRKEAA